MPSSSWPLQRSQPDSVTPAHCIRGEHNRFDCASQKQQKQLICEHDNSCALLWHRDCKHPVMCIEKEKVLFCCCLLFGRWGAEKDRKTDSLSAWGRKLEGEADKVLNKDYHIIINYHQTSKNHALPLFQHNDLKCTKRRSKISI